MPEIQMKLRAYQGVERSTCSPDTAQPALVRFFWEVIYVRRVIGMIVIVCGIGFGIYIGLWVCFIGGVIDVIEQVRSVELSASATIWGMEKIAFAGSIGYLIGGCISFLGGIIHDRWR
jgi:hypothetical protein